MLSAFLYNHQTWVAGFSSSTQTLSRLCFPLRCLFLPVLVWKWVSIFLFSVVVGWLGAQASVPNTILTAGWTQGRRGGQCKVLRDPGPSTSPRHAKSLSCSAMPFVNCTHSCTVAHTKTQTNIVKSFQSTEGSRVFSWKKKLKME